LDRFGPERRLVAEACRVLATEGLVDNVLGHVSMRVGEHQMLIRCRGPEERGLLFSEAGDIRLVDFDGNSDELGGSYKTPSELPIHGELMRLRPDVSAVVHAHPPAIVTCGLAGIGLRPVFGAFNIPAMRMGVAGVPIYRRSVLIRRPSLAHEMIDAMGGQSYCLLRGHGLTFAASSVEQAVVGALNLNILATMNLELARAGGHAEDVPEGDLAELPDLGPAFNDEAVWRFYAAKARRTSMTKEHIDK
jgi:ribulose-5-phosphate 4-epimerase/fuculose-1-phosphate aldolase